MPACPQWRARLTSGRLIVTGVGMVATAARVARALARTPYDVAFNFGVCGSFDRALALGQVVHVTSDALPSSARRTAIASSDDAGPGLAPDAST